jgi:hypothetical protein
MDRDPAGPRCPSRASWPTFKPEVYTARFAFLRYPLDKAS